MRQVQMCKWLLALRLQSLRTRLHQRIIGRGKRQLVDYHQLQRLAHHVNPFPERRRRHQHTARSARRGRLAKTCNQLALGEHPLHQHLDARLRGKVALQRRANAAHGTQGGGQNQRAPTEHLHRLRGQ